LLRSLSETARKTVEEIYSLFPVHRTHQSGQSKDPAQLNRRLETLTPQHPLLTSQSLLSHHFIEYQ
jgi:hypothetical protein